MVRLFVGGLPPGTTCEQLKQRFSVFGTVHDGEVVPPKTYVALQCVESFHRGFGFVELEPKDEHSLRQCMNAYNGSKWRGFTLKCQEARPKYMQRLQQARAEECLPQDQTELLKRKFPPLQPGSTLRIRLPSKPTPVEVVLESGQKSNVFPELANGTTAHGCDHSDWEPLPTPPGARYPFEGRLRAIQEEHAKEAVDMPVDEEHDAERSFLHTGASIPFQYSPTSSQEGDSPLATLPIAARGGHTLSKRSQQQAKGGLEKGKHEKADEMQLGLLPRTLKSAAGQQRLALERQQGSLKRQKVVDFMDEDTLPAQGRSAGAQLVDLSRFDSDSEGEGVQRSAQPARGRIPAGGAHAQRAQQGGLQRHIQNTSMGTGRVGGRGRQGFHQGGRGSAQSPEQHQHQLTPQRISPPCVIQVSLSGRENSSQARGEPPPDQGAGVEEPQPLLLDPMRVGRGEVVGRHARQRVGLDPVEQPASKAGREVQAQRRREEGLQEQVGPRGGALRVLDEGQPGSEPALHLHGGQAPREWLQAHLDLGGPSQEPPAPPLHAAVPSALGRAGQEGQHVARDRPALPRAKQGAQRAVIDFLSPQERQQRRPQVDLSRFGDDSEDEVGPPAGRQRAHQDRRSRGTGGVIPQVDGAWDSAGDSSSSGGSSSSSEGGSEEGSPDLSLQSADSQEASGSHGEADGSDDGEAEGEGTDRDSSSSSSSGSESDTSRSDAEAGGVKAPGGAHPAQTKEHLGGDKGGRGETSAPGEQRDPLHMLVGREGVEPQAGEAHGEGERAGAAPAWLSRLLPAGAGFRRVEREEQVEAQWRVGREGWAQDYRAKHRQAVRHLGRSPGKRQRRK